MKRARGPRYVVLVLVAAAAFAGLLRLRGAREPSYHLGEIVHERHASGLGYRARPHLFFILIDTLRADHLGAYGYSRPTSPTIGRVAAEEGVLFERCYSVAPWTNPALATLFTGKYPQSVSPPAPHHVAITKRLPDNVDTLAEILQDAGYRTVGLVDHPGINERLGYSRGFDEFHDLYLESGAGYWQRTDPEFVLEAFQEATRSAATAEEPLFVYLHLVYPHRPYIPGPRYAEMFGSGFTEIEESQRQGVINMYDAEIRQTDDLLGELFAEMKAGAWYDETAILFTSDHGEGFWEHGLAEHGSSFFDEEIHVPLVVVPPGGRREAPARIERPVSNVGVFATVLDFAGRVPERGVHGRSLLRFLRDGEPGEPDAPPEWFFSESPHSGDIYAAAALSSRGDKYVRYRSSERFPDELLFDVQEDPAETRNLAGDDSEELAALRSLLREHLDMNRLALAAADQETVDVDPEELERLRALGYVE